MDRKQSIKTLLMGSISLPFFKVSTSEKTEQTERVQDSEPVNSRWPSLKPLIIQVKKVELSCRQQGL